MKKLYIIYILFFFTPIFLFSSIKNPKNADELNNKYSSVLSVLIKNIESIENDYKNFSSYSKILKNVDKNNINQITIENEEYWKIFFSISYDNPEIYFSRIFLLLIDGNLAKAELVLLFSMYNYKKNDKFYQTVLNSIYNDIILVRKNSNIHVKKGIKKYDKGDYNGALKHFEKALLIHPKNEWALYEIGLTYNTMNLLNIKNSDLTDDKAYNFFKQVREISPFYNLAYQGNIKKNPEIKKYLIILLDTINPSLEKIGRGELTRKTIMQFADGCKKMDQYEFALYAMRLALILQKENENDISNKVIIKKTMDYLNELHFKNTAENYYKRMKVLIE